MLYHLSLSSKNSMLITFKYIYSPFSFPAAPSASASYSSYSMSAVIVCEFVQLLSPWQAQKAEHWMQAVEQLHCVVEQGSAD